MEGQLLTVGQDFVSLKIPNSFLPPLGKISQVISVLSFFDLKYCHTPPRGKSHPRGWLEWAYKI